MEKNIPFFRKVQEAKKIFFILLFAFLSPLIFGQTITPSKTVTQNVSSCGIIDVELKVIGANPIARPLEVVLVIDVSGSMTSGSPDTSMDHAKDAAIDFINNIFLPANNPTGLNKVAIVSYSTTATINQVLTLSSGKTGLISVVNGLVPNGLTNIQDGIVKADNELTAHGSFNCNTSRSIILLTDGVANRTGPTGVSCSGGTGGTCIQSAITAATNAKTTTVSSVVYNNQIFSVGLFGGISGTDQTNATYCLNNIQSGGAFFTENAANLTGIYSQILNQISWVATQISGTSFNTETVSNNFDIVPASIVVSKGSFIQTGQVIKWNIDFLNAETITLKYQLTPKPNICGDNIVSTSRLDYLNSSCLAAFQNISTPNYCVPCAPILSTLPSTTTINCPATPNFTTPTITNGCLSTSLTFVDVTTPGTCLGKYSIKRTWTASNSCYTSTASQTINVQDVTAPVFAPLPAISTINCPAVPNFATATATDTCGGTVTLTFADVTTPGTCAGNYSITRTWTAKDTCNNTSTASQTINVQDVTAPVIASLPDISTINCPAVPNFATATATDACGGTVTLTFADITTLGTCAGNYSITRTWTAKDTCNNTSTASQTINVQDVTAPVIATLPAISTINCPAVPNFATATATDACGGTVTLTFADITTLGTCAGNYSITRTWTAKDTCNNTSTASQTINVQDVTAPVIATLPAISTINCPAVPNFATATATDACGGTVALTFADVTTPGTCAGNYSITRTWTAKDTCNNTSTASQTINVQDVTAPVIAPLPTISTINCPAVPNFATATATDVCGGTVTLTFADVTTPGTCAGNYSITRTWTAKDTCNNTSTASQTINVQDVTAPTFTIQTNNMTVECDGNGNLAELNAWLATNGGASATDTCSGVTWTNNYSGSLSDLCGLTGSATVTFTATDACGNFSSSTGTFTIQDTTNPNLTTQASSQTVECDGNGNLAELNAWLASNGGASATDTCSGVTWTNNYSGSLSDLCGLTGATTVTFTATDACGNFSTSTGTFTIQDTTNPNLTTQASSQTVECDGNGNLAELNAWLASNGGASATDTCSGVTWTNNYSGSLSDLCGLTGATTVTFTATDACGNFSTSTGTFTIQDTTNPNLITQAVSQTVECDGNGNLAELNAWLASNGGASATDTCSGVTWTNNYSGSLSDLCGLTGATTVTFTATDACGNFSTSTGTFTIQDTTNPNLITQAVSQTVECDGNGNLAELTTWLASNGGASATDTCSGVTWTNNYSGSLSDLCGLTGATTVTFTATDACGNFSTSTGTFTIQDTTNPNLITQAVSQTVECDGNGNLAELNAWLASNGGASATDTCSGVTWTNNYSGSLSDLCGLTGATTVTFTATDACGNFSTSTGTFTIQDTTNPNLTTQASSQTFECDGNGNLAELNAWLASNGGASATDTCSGVTWTNNYSGSLSDLCGLTGATTVTFTATDACGNFSTSTGTFTIQDTTNPNLITQAISQTVECDGNGNLAELNAWLASNGGASATDTCSGVTWTNNYSGSLSDLCGLTGSATVTFTATDACGNFSTSTGTFTIQDTTNPNLTTQASSQTVECDGNGNLAELNAWLASNGGASATDTCSGVTWTNNYSGSLSDLCGLTGATTVTFTATDACGNFSTSTGTFTIQDTTNPNLITQAVSQTVECDGNGNLAELNAWLASNGGASATDTCSGVTWTNNYSGSLSDLCGLTGATTVTFTATDACGNFSTSTGTFTIQDTTNPNLITQAVSQTVECDGNGNLAELTTWLASNGGASATDTCSSVTWTNNYSGSLSDLCGLTGSAMVTFTATDACGNFSTSTGTFTIQDTANPNLTTQAISQTVECDGNGNLAELTTWLASNGGASATDTCSSVTWTNNYSGSLSNLCGLTGSATVTFTATDACGNFSSSTGTFTIQDTTPPVFTSELPQNISVSCDAIPLPQELTGVDSCSSEITIATNDNIVENESSCTGEFTILRTWIISDSCGNNQTYTQTISVYDTTAPTLVTPMNSEIDAICSEVPPKPNLEFTDNCSGVEPNIIYTETTTTVSIYQYVIVRNWIVSDNCGNEANFSQTINVSVNEPFDAIPYRICKNETIDLFSLLEDGLPTNGTWVEVNTSGALSGSVFNPSNLAFGYYTIRYIVTVENNTCPSIYEIYINVANCDVLAACDIIVYNAVSPNGDGLNEIFMIDGITCYPNNTVEIYNKWGVLIYKASGYNNGNVSFNGTSQNKLNFNGDKLPGDSYFYILKYKDTQDNSYEKTGYLYIKY